MPTRRDFLRTAALGATAAAAAPHLLARAADAPGRRAPLLARHRQLFNGDTCVYFYNPERWQPEGGPFSARAIHRYVENLRQNGIDTFVINANASRAWYPSKAIPTILDGYRRGDREFFRGHAVCAGATKPADVEKYLDDAVVFFNRYLDLLEAGVDWLAETSVACRQRGVAPWVSIRMNDLHGHKNFTGSFFNHPLLRDPAMRLRHSRYPSMAGDPTYREGLNYERPEVRAMMFAQIREVVEDYDFDGLELDWWRNPLCCEPEATAATVAMMTDWFREIRALTERRAARTGRAFYLGMRLPARLETLRAIGLDVVTLAREGTLDFLAPSAFWRTAWDLPHDELRRAVGDGPAIFGVIEDGVNALPTLAPAIPLTRDIRLMSASVEHLRANAAGKLVLGADGIEWYNFFCTDQVRIPGTTSDYPLMRDLHRLDALRGRPKHYAFADFGFTGLSQPPFEAPPQVPVVLAQNWRRSFRLPMCAEPAGRELRLVVQVVARKADPVGDLPVSVNGSWPRAERTATDRLLFPCGAFTHHTPDHVAYNYEFPVELIRDGWNEIVLENGAAEPVTIAGLELAVMGPARA
ncbi:MAG: twin-arginine translocation signal domain-containing protein [Verrucomicrobia bacterium]|nr:twin-arginine translocation signal domain-containing protein [Verrucomicrobiota bacterium]